MNNFPEITVEKQANGYGITFIINIKMGDIVTRICLGNPQTVKKEDWREFVNNVINKIGYSQMIFDVTTNYTCVNYHTSTDKVYITTQRDSNYNKFATCSSTTEMRAQDCINIFEKMLKWREEIL